MNVKGETTREDRMKFARGLVLVLKEDFNARETLTILVCALIDLWTSERMPVVLFDKTVAAARNTIDELSKEVS